MCCVLCAAGGCWLLVHASAAQRLCKTKPTTSRLQTLYNLMKRQSTKAAAQPSKVVQQMPKAEAQPPRKKTRAQNKPALKPAFDVRQITKLRLNFQPKVRPSRKPALEHECRVYHKLTFREVKQAVQLRELKWSYAKIANKMKRYPNAVHYALKQWDRRGGQYADGRRNNG